MGHALGGLAIGLLITEHGGERPATSSMAPRWLQTPYGRAALFAAVACAPDLDLIVGTHSAETHSIGAVAIATLALLAWTRQLRLALAGGAVYASHLLFDWIGRDTSPPLGIMALWPFSREYYIAPVALLEPVSRRYWLPGFWLHNVKVGLSELAIFGSFAALVWWRRVARGPQA